MRPWWLLVWTLVSCRCERIETISVAAPMGEEAGPGATIPSAAQPPVPRLDRLVHDEASVERSGDSRRRIGRLVDQQHRYVAVDGVGLSRTRVVQQVVLGHEVQRPLVLWARQHLGQDRIKSHACLPGTP